MWTRRALIGFLVAIVVAGLLGLLGVHSRSAEAVGDGYTLKVHYAWTARPGISVPFEVQVEHPGGFQGPITLTVSDSYLSSLANASVEPQATSSTNNGESTVFVFTPPSGDTFSASWGSQIDPSTNFGRLHATISLIDQSRSVASVRITTLVLP